MKKYFKRIMLFIVSFSIALVLSGCGDKETGYKDTIERPNDIPPLAELDYVEYPAKPEGMEAGQGSGMPTIGNATTDSEYYKITEADGKITIKFNEVGRWDYIYLPIENFNEEYQNIKITATATNIQKISFQAVYYEMYDNKMPAVTTLIHDVGDTEQFYIMELGKTKLLDASYNPTDEVLGKQTVIGLCIFIDSNPSQTVVNKNTEIESVFEISKVEFLKDGDKALADRFVEPSLSVGWLDAGYAAVKNDETKEYTITKLESAGIYESASLNISNYSSEYSAFNLKFTTTNVKTLTIELTVSGGQSDWQPNVTVYKTTNLEDGQHEAYIDFTTIEPVDLSWNTVPGYYIKNYKISAMKIYLDTADQAELTAQEGVCVINEIKFERLVSEGALLSKGWTTASSSITFGDDLAIGGIGTVYFDWHAGWDFFSIPVLNYEPAEKLVIKFQANEGLYNFGVALGGGSYSVNSECVLKGSRYKLTTIEEKVGDIEDLVETVSYDQETKIYTITFDFSDLQKLAKYGDKRVNEMQITSLRFYLNDNESKDVFEGKRSIRFISISFE